MPPASNAIWTVVGVLCSLCDQPWEAHGDEPSTVTSNVTSDYRTPAVMSIRSAA
jgi:hypothetical protein